MSRFPGVNRLFGAAALLLSAVGLAVARDVTARVLEADGTPAKNPTKITITFLPAQEQAVWTFNTDGNYRMTLDNAVQRIQAFVRGDGFSGGLIECPLSGVSFDCGEVRRGTVARPPRSLQHRTPALAASTQSRGVSRQPADLFTIHENQKVAPGVSTIVISPPAGVVPSSFLLEFKSSACLAHLIEPEISTPKNRNVSLLVSPSQLGGPVEIPWESLAAGENGSRFLKVGSDHPVANEDCLFIALPRLKLAGNRDWTSQGELGIYLRGARSEPMRAVNSTDATHIIARNRIFFTFLDARKPRVSPEARQAMDAVRELTGHGLDTTPLTVCEAAELGMLGALEALQAAGAGFEKCWENPDRPTPLVLAALNNRNQAIDFLAKTPAFGTGECDGRYALLAASGSGSKDAFDAIVGHNLKALVDSCYEAPFDNPLIAASGAGNTAIVQRIVAHDTKALERTDRHGNTALMLAAEKGFDEIVGILLDKRANANPKNRSGRTALTIAALNGHIKVVEILATVPGTTLDPEAPLVVAEAGYAGVLTALFNHSLAGDVHDLAPAFTNAAIQIVGPKVRDATCSDLCQRRLAGSLRPSQLLSAANWHAHGPDPRRDYPAVMQRLLDHGFRFRSGDHTQVAFTLAAAASDNLTLDLLRRAGANPDAAVTLKHALIGTTIGSTNPAFIAAQEGHFDTLKLLLDWGASPRQPKSNDAVHGAILDWAVLHRNLEVVNALLPKVDLDELVSVSGHESRTALMDAVEEGFLPAVEALLPNSKVDLSGGPATGTAVTRALAALSLATPAARPIAEKIAILVIDKTADPGHASAIRINPASFDDTFEELTPLYLAIRTASPEAVKKLLAKGRGIVRYCPGCTGLPWDYPCQPQTECPLSVAVQAWLDAKDKQPYSEIIRALIAAGADRTQRCIRVSAQDLARSDPELRNLLRR